MEDMSLVMPGVATRATGACVRASSRRACCRRLRRRRAARDGRSRSVALALGGWQLVCLTISQDFPTPLASLRVTLELLARSVREGGRNARHRTPGAGVAAAGRDRLHAQRRRRDPGGHAHRREPQIRKLFDPIVQVLRPVSPLVWFPLALVAFKNVGGVSSSTLFTIFVTSLWPTLINTAFGVSLAAGRLPDRREGLPVLARCGTCARSCCRTRCPHILTGLRLSMGMAWLVIVAAEMLSGDMGIGFFAWDAYNAGSYEKMIAAVAAIGGVGLALDRGFSALSRRFDYQGASR